MHHSHQSEPSVEEALRLYRRLLEGDPVAPPDFANAFLNPLIAWLQRTNRQIDPMACEEAAGEAIFSFILNVAKYVPEDLEVAAFLRMAAKRDLLNLLRKESRHQRQRRDLRLVELEPAAGKYLEREDDPSLSLQIEEAKQERLPPNEVWQQLTEAERRFLERMQEGERSTSAFAAILGLTELSVEEQRREVKRVKDRLKKRLERTEGTHGRSP